MKQLAAAIAVATACTLAGCGPSSLRVEPVKIEPIHLQIDVTLHDGDATTAEPPKPGESTRGK